MQGSAGRSGQIVIGGDITVNRPSEARRATGTLSAWTLFCAAMMFGLWIAG